MDVIDGGLDDFADCLSGILDVGGGVERADDEGCGLMEGEEDG